jgi:hypothetical protein
MARDRVAGSRRIHGDVRVHYPTTWDPFFADYMTLADVYRYPTQHFRFHQHPANVQPRQMDSPSA